MTFPYVVQPGDTLPRISARHGINLTALYSANPQLLEESYLYPGQIIGIPERPASRYIVQEGDTLSAVADRFGVPPAELQAANRSAVSSGLCAGQTLTIPPARGRGIVRTGMPYGYEELTGDMHLLLRRYPEVTAGVIGRSVMGRDIPWLRLGTGAREVHYNGSFHANEWITSLLLMKFAEDCAQAQRSGTLLEGRKVKDLLQETSLWLVPMVNPDGVELVLQGASPVHPCCSQLLEWNQGSPDFTDWKANIRGVDLNDQFPAGWEAERDRRAVPGPGARDYTGAAPLSEPEAAAMAAFTRSRNFRLVMAFHTQGRELYWNYRDLEPAESEGMAQTLERLTGYRAVKLTGSDAGYKDWFIQEFRAPGFTVEAGTGINPLPLSQFREIYRDLLPLLLEGLRL